MMPIDFHGTNATLSKPDYLKDYEVIDCRAVKDVDKNGMAFWVTKWMPNKEDIDAFIAGRGLYLKIYGPEHPPVMIVTFDNDNEINFVE